MREGWTFEDGHHPAWIYKDGEMWVRHYPATQVMGEHWQAYRILGKRKSGRKPWANDNKRIGAGDGFRSLVAAMEAVEFEAIAKP